jgi:LmbE family N-acetylglucosaminyl deacetylase
MMQNKIYLFFSPHLDDVVLSCGGYVSRLASAGEQVCIITAVTADAPEGTILSKQMKWRYLIWRQGSTAPFKARCSEDEASAALLNVNYEHLGLLDAVFRCDRVQKPLYPTINVNVPIHDEDFKCFVPDLNQKIEQVLNRWERQRVIVFCPLGIGGHVDHVLTRHVIENVCDRQNIIYYEDYPYVNKLDAEKSVNEINDTHDSWDNLTVNLTTSEIEARISAVACHVSQIPILFPSKLQHFENRISLRSLTIGKILMELTGSNVSRERIAMAISDYVSRVGGERYWFRSSGQIPHLDMVWGKARRQDGTYHRKA